MSWSEICADLRLALRQMRRHPSHSLTCIALFALGLGANAAIVSVLYFTVFKPLPYRDPSQLVAVHNRFPQLDLQRLGASSLDYLDLRDHRELFADAGALYYLDLTRTGIERPQKVNAIAITASLFHTLGSAPLLGRWFNETEERYHGAHAVILSEPYWRDAFGGDPQILERTLQLNGELYPIVGVMPKSFSFPNNVTEMWVPVAFTPHQLAGAARTNHYLTMYARLAPGVDLGQASVRIEELSRQFSLQHPDEYPFDRLGWRFFLQPMGRDDDGSLRRWLLVLFAAVVCLLLIVCANVAGLFLVRSVERQFDISLRRALGASRFRIAQQVLSEILLLALAGGALGMVAARVGVQILAKYGPVPNTGLARPAFWFNAALSISCGVACGLHPAWIAARNSSVDLLREGGHQKTASGSSRRLQSGLIVAQVAVATTLLICGGLLIRSLVRLLDVNPGFDAKNVLTLQISLPPQRFASPASRLSFYRTVLDRTGQIPGVAAASGCTLLPFGYGASANTFEIVGRPKAAVEPYANLSTVAPGYFDTMKISLLGGRSFSPADRIGSVPVVLVDQTMAQRYFPNENPIGRQLKLPWDKPFTIVGVVGSVRTSGLEIEGRPTIYFSADQYPSTDLTLVIRTAIAGGATASEVERIVASVEKDQPIYDVSSLQTRIDRSIKTRRFVVFLVVIFAAAGTVLASLGLYGLLAYTIALRRREIGIRMALGADRAAIAALVYRGGLSLVVAGLLMGCIGAVGVHRYIDTQLYDTNFADYRVWISVIAIVGFTGVLSCALPAFRCARMSPLDSLRAD